jgi:protease I
VANQPLQGMRVAILVDTDFEEAELTEPRRALLDAGAQALVVSPQTGEIQGVHHDVKGQKVKVDLSLDQANPDDFDAVMIPGGALNVDALRMNRKAQDFVRRIDETDRPIAVICHGPWLLVSAGLVNGRTLTSYFSIQDDLRNAGGFWLDLAPVRDRNWVSARSPKDLAGFNPAMVDVFAQYLRARPRGQAA